MRDFSGILLRRWIPACKSERGVEQRMAHSFAECIGVRIGRNTHNQILEYRQSLKFVICFNSPFNSFFFLGFCCFLRPHRAMFIPLLVSGGISHWSIVSVRNYNGSRRVLARALFVLFPDTLIHSCSLSVTRVLSSQNTLVGGVFFSLGEADQIGGCCFMFMK